jgi:type II secretory pathway component PulF
MAVFTYQGTDRAARPLRGTIAADSPREARDQLRSQGLLVESLAAQQSSTRSTLRFLQRPSRHAAQLALAIRDLSTLLGTGIGLVDALDTLSSQYKGCFQASLLALRQQVASGTSLSDAMQADGAVYDELTVHMVRVGENSGHLDAVLDRLADFRERYLLFKDRITTALIYPAIVVILAALVSAFLMTVVLPMLLENLVDSGRPLPWPTRVLKGLSDLAVAHGVWILAAGAAAAALLATAIKTPRGRRLWHRLFFALPLLGPLAKKQEIARVALIISTLMKNGIVFVEAAQIAARASKNVLLREALEAMRSRVRAGRDIGDALAVGSLFPPLVIQIFTVGQQTGALEEMLDRLSSGYERQVASATSRLTAALEPILIVFLAIVVGFILFATILPILEAGNVL